MFKPQIDTQEPRPTCLEVDLGQLAANYHAILAHLGGVPAMPILKANAYGHGLVPVAKLMEHLGAPILGLAFLEEAIALRRAGITSPILVLGGILGNQIPRFLEHDLILSASSVDKLQAIDACATAVGVRARVHLKIDTGMERIGVHWYSAEALLEASLRCASVDVLGIFSHLSTSDEADTSLTRLQLERFCEVLRFYEARSLPCPVRHLANSGAVLQHPDTWFDLVRPGILTYGVLPSDQVPVTVPVQPALTWKSRVVYFKVVQAGQPVSYGATWAPADWTRVVTVPVGYGDGYPRALSNRAEVLIGGQRLPVRGRVCMDQIMADLGRGEAYNGDEVVLLGRQGDQRVTVEALAAWVGTIPYEILTGINTRVPRIYLNDPFA
ncbi:MAG TPA: alanine racemase [Deltaproteobacteria bacterium]|nr:alanine racemase [Deltaproteobacteria bacterium]